MIALAALDLTFLGKEALMYERIELAEGPVMGLRISDRITDRENRSLVQLIEKHAQQYGPLRLLVVYETGQGPTSAESLYENLRFAKLAGDRLSKMAVVGKRGWQNTWVGLFGLFGGIQTAYYDHERIDEALTWLKE
jgi:hypothetical protein